MPRKKRDTSSKRASILDAAVEAFVQEGYDVASMDRIAELAGASKRTVYNHFGSKDELLQAVLDRFLEQSEGLKAIPYQPEQDLAEQLSAFIDAKLATIENSAWYGLSRMALGLLIRDSALARTSLARYAAGDDTLEAWIEAAVADGRLAAPDAGLAAAIFWSMVSGALSWPQLIGGPLPAAQLQPIRAEIVATFLTRYQA